MESMHRLEGSSGGVGGLVVRKKTTDLDKDSPSKHKSTFKEPPKNSLLGLDVLAATKRKLQVRQYTNMQLKMANKGNNLG